MKFFIVLAVALVACAAPAWGKRYTRCSLAKELHGMGIPKSELPQWTCLAEHESSFDTHLINKHNTDGSWDFGLFQINSRYWCQQPNYKSTNNCHVNCKDLLSDNIHGIVNCARQVKAKQGFQAWAAWKHCNGRLRSIDDCFK